MLRHLLIAVVAWFLVGTLANAQGLPAPAPGAVRFATFNIEILSAEKLKSLDGQGHGNHPQLLKAAEIIQRIRPDVLLINEID